MNKRTCKKVGIQIPDTLSIKSCSRMSGIPGSCYNLKKNERIEFLEFNVVVTTYKKSEYIAGMLVF